MLLLFTFIILVLFIFIVLNVKKSKGKITIAFLILLITSCYFSELPAGVKHFINTAIPPDGLYEPIILDEFPLFCKDYSGIYSFSPKYSEIYSIGFYVDDNSLPKGYRYKGRLKVDILVKENVIYSKEITKSIAASYLGNDLSRYSKIYLFDFEFPIHGEYRDDVEIKLTVLEPDEQLNQFNEKVKIFVGVSPL